MAWGGLVINVIAIFIGFFLYVGFFHTRFGKRFEEYQYFVLLVILIVTCILGGLLRRFLF